jgi:formylglycine-generating enzyme required for sulfatase activity
MNKFNTTSGRSVPQHATRERRWAWIVVLAIAALAALGVNAMRSEPAPSLPPSLSMAAAVPATFFPTVENTKRPPEVGPDGMVWIPGGEFSMGAADPMGADHNDVGMHATDDSRPIHRTYVDGFWMDRTEVTNRQFATFVKETGYVTLAERTPAAKDFPGAPPENLFAGSVIFSPPDHAVPLNNNLRWWAYVKGANWRHPQGPDSSIVGKENYPVVDVAYEDAVAYAAWAGTSLPTEAEWEFAARGGLSGQVYPWGDQFEENGRPMANTHQGHFPDHDTGKDGFAGIRPVAQYPANGYGLYDVAGNVWEWVSDWYRPDYYAILAAKGSVAHNPQGPPASFDPGEPGVPKRVQRGGSFLCTEQYCSRYMVGTRGKGEVSTGTNHVGFRTIISPSRANAQ